MGAHWIWSQAHDENRTEISVVHPLLTAVAYHPLPGLLRKKNSVRSLQPSPSLSPFLPLLLQACRPYCQSTCGRASCRLRSATSAATRRASSCVGRGTAGVSAAQSTPGATAPRWTSEPWRPAWCTSETPGSRPTRTLRSRVSVTWFIRTRTCVRTHTHPHR